MGCQDGISAMVAGLREEFDRGRLPETDETRLLRVVHSLRWPLTLSVFLAAFVAGACLAWTSG